MIIPLEKKKMTKKKETERERDIEERNAEFIKSCHFTAQEADKKTKAKQCAPSLSAVLTLFHSHIINKTKTTILWNRCIVHYGNFSVT